MSSTSVRMKCKMRRNAIDLGIVFFKDSRLFRNIICIDMRTFEVDLNIPAGKKLLTMGKRSENFASSRPENKILSSSFLTFKIFYVLRFFFVRMWSEGFQQLLSWHLGYQEKSKFGILKTGKDEKRWVSSFWTIKIFHVLHFFFVWMWTSRFQRLLTSRSSREVEVWHSQFWPSKLFVSCTSATAGTWPLSEYLSQNSVSSKREMMKNSGPHSFWHSKSFMSSSNRIVRLRCLLDLPRFWSWFSSTARQWFEGRRTVRKNVKILSKWAFARKKSFKSWTWIIFLTF